LYLDIFGLGPPEVLIIIGSVLLFYGPERVRGQLRDRGVQNEVIQSKGPLKDREDRIEDLTNFADQRRKQRAWQRVNERIENEDPEIMEKLDEVGL
jgi:Sec-independent protein translocase protein TatA